MAQSELDLVRMHAGSGDYLTPAEGRALLADRDRLAAEAAVQQTAMVRALGQDIDGLGPPGLGRFYLVLEVPTGPLDDVLTEAVTSGRIGLVRAGS
jgi:hypothetical protein